MVKFMKSGRVAIVLRGRFAGRKVVILQANDEGTKDHPFPHAFVAGVDKYPKRITREMLDKEGGKAKVAKRCRVKPFLRIINYSHLLPTRYALDEAQALSQSVFDVLEDGTLGEPSQRKEAKDVVRQNFEERYVTGKNKWVFTPLLF